MKQIKFLHFSDLHLDYPFTSLGSDLGKTDRRRKDLLEVFDSIIELTKRENADLLLISGDLYEHFYVKKSTIKHVNDKFREIDDKKVFIVPGNHDPYLKNSYYRNFKWNSNVYILSEERYKVEIEELNTCVYGLGFESFYKNGCIRDEIKSVNDEKINIFLVHGTVDMNFTKTGYNLFTSEELAQLNMDYIALGHFHNRIDDVGQKGVIYNPGSPEPLGFDEEGEHGVFVGKVSKELLEVKYINTNRRYYKSVDINVENINSNEQVAEKIRFSLEGLPIEDILLTITLKGFAKDEYRISKEKLKNLLEDSFFYVNVEDRTIPDYDYEEMKNEPGLKGLYVRKLMGMIDEAKNEKEKYLLMKSLYYGLQALDKGKIEEL
ncbi:metallophosphoesterase family protein [Acetivibrio clariflavus]|uniref:DNA repair exonuclease n=1 Tax=Acetivibrio clariflavus (strain DSM 19732 / NBRC 101661 / EBR45) TaxID=720554 RepID=G8LZD7_ACECE|nr:DNA repair exonuclease [Acetivibrio clariflavus]AEV66800.1 DNA repair exonuclease [Acetivibrio clariflavus DSM 19732]